MQESLPFAKRKGFLWAECEWPDIIKISPAYNVKTSIAGDIFLKSYIEERAMEIARYIIDNNATVRQTAKKFGISKSTVHMVVTK